MGATDDEAKDENVVVDDEAQRPKDAANGTAESPERMILSGMKLQLLTLTCVYMVLFGGRGAC